MSYAGREKYDEPGRAARYRGRSARRNVEEWALIESLLEQLPTVPTSALDVPCGTGRIAEMLLERGIPTRAADLSPAMLAEAESRLAGKPGFGGVVALDLEDAGEHPPEPADLVVCLRLLHHLPDKAHRMRVLRTLGQLTRGHLILSFHHPISVHNAKRGLRRLFTGRRGDRYTIRPAELEREAAEVGLQLLSCVALAAYRREFWLALFTPAP